MLHGLMQPSNCIRVLNYKMAIGCLIVVVTKGDTSSARLVCRGTRTVQTGGPLLLPHGNVGSLGRQSGDQRSLSSSCVFVVRGTVLVSAWV